MNRKTKDGEAKTDESSMAGDDACTEIARLRATLSDLVTRANNGEQLALAQLRRFMDEHPEVEETAGDLTRHAEALWLELLAGEDTLGREAVQRQLAKLKAELAGSHPTGMERLLVDEIGLCHLARRHAELGVARPASESLALATFRLRRAESAQKRLLTAVKTLAQLRALVPAGLAPLHPLHNHAGERKRA